jgi:hypothetical protein
MSEIRTVDEQNAIWLFRHDLTCRLSDAQHKSRQVLDDRAKPHESNFMGVEEGFKATCRQMIATDTNKIDQPVGLMTQGVDQIRPEKIAGFFTGHDCYFQWPAGVTQA